MKFHLIVLLVIPIGLFAQINHSRIAPLLEKANIPGMSVAVIADTSITTINFGYQNKEQQQLIDDNTIFQAASLSKPVVALLALKLHEQDKLDLDQPLWRLVTYPKIENVRWAKKITPRMVLSHTTGMPNWGRSSIRLKGEPGKQWGYSGEAFVWLSLVIEYVVGKPFEQIIEEEVLNPLGMTNSSFIWNPKYETQASRAYDEIGIQTDVVKFDQPNAAASLWTTTTDYAKFLRGILQKKLLKSFTYREMLRPEATLSETDGQLQWALGLGFEKSSNNYWHWGDNRVFRCFTYFDTKEKKGMVYFTNSENGLTILEDMLQIFNDQDHPLIKWLDYPSYQDELANGRKRLKKALYEENVDKAAAIYDQLMSSKEIDISFISNLSNSLKEYNKADVLIPLMEKHLERNPTDFNSHEILGELLTLNKEYPKAKTAYEKAVALNPQKSSSINLRLRWLEEGIRAKNANKKPTFLTIFTGKYHKYRIQRVDYKLVLNDLESGEVVPLLPMTKDIFEIDAQVKYRLKFDWNSRNKIEGFTLHGIDGMITYYPKN